MQDHINAIAASIPTPTSGKRVVVGIDGLSRSGKTTIVKKLQASLHEKGFSVTVLHIDDYIVEKIGVIIPAMRNGMNTIIYNGMSIRYENHF